MYLMLHLDLDLIIRNAIETREISVDGDAEESRNMSDPIIGSVDFSYLSSVGEDTHLQPRLAKLITGDLSTFRLTVGLNASKRSI